MSYALKRRIAAAVPGLFLLACLGTAGACRRPVPVASVACQPTIGPDAKRLPMLIDGHLWIATVLCSSMQVSASDAAPARSFSYELTGGNEDWWLVNAAVKPSGSAVVYLRQAGCYRDCSAKILEVYPRTGTVRERWGGQLPDAVMTLEVFLPTDEPVLIGMNQWFVLRDGLLQPFSFSRYGTRTWSGRAGVGLVYPTYVTIVAANGSSVSWSPPSGTFAVSAAYSGLGHIGVVIRGYRWMGESLVILTEDGRQHGPPQPLGRGYAWGATSCGEFAALNRGDRIRRLMGDTLGPEMSLGRSDTLIPVPGWSREAMVFEAADEVCLVR